MPTRGTAWRLPRPVTDAAPTGAAQPTDRLGEPVFRSRVARLHASRSYGIVLLIVIGNFLFAALAPDGAWSTSLLVLVETALLMTAIWTSGSARVGSHPVLAIALIGICAALGRVLRGGEVVTVIVGLVAGLMVLASIAVIARGVLDQGEVNRQSIRGALGIYILLGLLFSFLFTIAAAVGSGPFFTNGTDGTRAIRTYFSYVTLATLGYGDYTPAGNGGHTLAIVEALTGQLYLVIVITLLVSRLGGRAFTPKD
jgi:Ion channel